MKLPLKQGFFKLRRKFCRKNKHRSQSPISKPAATISDEHNYSPMNKIIYIINNIEKTYFHIN